MKLRLYKFFIVIAFMAISIALSGCQNMASSFFSNSAPVASEADTSGQSGLAIKNYEQLYNSMATLTEIDPTTYAPAIKSYYDSNKLALPQTNSINDLQPSHLITITNLAAEFCFGLFEDIGCNSGANCSSRVRAFFQGTSLSNLNQQSRLFTVLGSSSVKIEVAQHMLNKFWGVEVQASPQRQQAEDALVTLITDLMEGFSTTNGGTFNDLKKVLEGSCSAALSSGPVIYF